MAGSIGKLTAAWASITNKNTLALANLNFDFASLGWSAIIE
jgi:hypothetical protein